MKATQCCCFYIFVAGLPHYNIYAPLRAAAYFVITPSINAMTLSATDIALLKKRLLEEKRELENTLSSLSSTQASGLAKVSYPDFGNDPGTSDEEADEVEEFETVLSEHAHISHRLGAITEAVWRIEKGTYGRCTHCKKEIPKERLEANPAAALCMECAT